MTHLIIIRGLPGSGKSTLAKKFESYRHVEADMFMVDENGDYKFDPNRLHECHTMCQEIVRKLLDEGHRVVVSNTFSRIWEMKPYLDMPYGKTVIECQGGFHNIHGVPNHVIESMKKRWEKYPVDT